MGLKKIFKAHTIFIPAVLIGAWSFTPKEDRQPEAIRPNILILMSDNHSWNHLGCYSDPVLKTPVIDNLANKEGVKELFELGFGMRPEEELYDLRNDPFQINNVTYSKEYEVEKESLSKRLSEYLKANQDPRELGGEMKWLGAKYFAKKDFYPRPSEEARNALNLEEEYSHIEK